LQIFANSKAQVGIPVATVSLVPRVKKVLLVDARCEASSKEINEEGGNTCGFAAAPARGCVVVLADVEAQGGRALRAVFVRVDLEAEAASHHTQHQVARVAHRYPPKLFPHVADRASAATLELGDHGVAAQQHLLHVQLALVVHGGVQFATWRVPSRCLRLLSQQTNARGGRRRKPLLSAGGEKRQTRSVCLVDGYNRTSVFPPPASVPFVGWPARTTTTY